MHTQCLELRSLWTIGPAVAISTLDLAKDYCQIPMTEESKDKTAFTTPFGLFKFEVMPFGLYSSPATFQRMINHVLRDCWPFARVYLDDIVMFSGSWKEHHHHLCQDLECLHKAKFAINMSKCQFGKSEVHYLGHVIGGGIVKPDPQKPEAVSNYSKQEGESIFRPLWLLLMVCATFCYHCGAFTKVDQLRPRILTRLGGVISVRRLSVS